MLAKLIKYNLKPIFKSILPFIVALFVSVVVFNLTDYTIEYAYETLEDGSVLLTDIIEPSSLPHFLHGFFNLAISCSIILLMATATRSIWCQFKISFYSDRAYLTHTLPVKRSMLWNAEVYSVAITFISIIVMLIISCLLLALTRDGMHLLESFGLIGGCSHCVGDYYHVELRSLGFYFSFAFIVFIELAFITLCGITGIIIKHRLSHGYSLIFGLGIYMIGTVVLLGIYCFIGAYLDSNISQFSNGLSIGTPDYSPNLDYVARTLLYLSVIYSCYCLALYFVDQKLLQRGINLD